MPSQTLNVLPGEYAICKLSPTEPVPSWAHTSNISSILHTPEELTIVCQAETVPTGTQVENGWRLLKLQGPFAFTETEILLAVLEPLANAKVGIFAISTFDTDYVLVKDTQVAMACGALIAAGHTVRM